MMRFDFETYLPEDVLTKVDRMSMAHSIESRVPLLDNEVDRLRRVAAGVAEDQERPAEARPEGSGRRRCCRAEILDRPKQGFGVPLGVWFRGDLRELSSPTCCSRREHGSAATSSRRSSTASSGAPARQARPHAAAVAARGLRDVARGVR